MTQNQKLRHLLEEAIRVGENLIDTLRETEEVRALITVHAKTEAALAEPTTGCLQCFSLKELRVSDLRKNDEIYAELRGVYAELHAAHAEVELLRKQLGNKSAAKSEELNAAWTEGTLAAGDAMRPQVAAAYHRGAEAMREAAADLFHGNKPGLAAIPTWSTFIRALPIPEDKQ